MEGETELTKGRRPRVDPSLGVRQVWVLVFFHLPLNVSRLARAVHFYLAFSLTGYIAPKVHPKVGFHRETAIAGQSKV